MKKWIFLSLIFLSGFSIAQKRDTLTTNAPLVTSTVYYGSGADLHHQSKINIQKGMQEIIFNQVAWYADINTLQISCPEFVTILSYKHRIYTPEIIQKPKPEPKKWLDSIKLLQRQIINLNSDINIKNESHQKLTVLIETNFNSPDKKNIVSDELIKLANYYTDKLALLKQQIHEVTVKRNDVQDIINDLNNKINEYYNQPNEEKQPKPVGQLIVQVMSSMSAAATFDFNYFTQNAGWSPSYDLRVKSIDNSFKIAYKGMVNQSTGLDWKGVKLSLSTSNPNRGNIMPILNPLFLSLYVPPIAYRKKNIQVTSVEKASTMSAMAITRTDSDDGLEMKDEGNGNTGNTEDVSPYLNLRENQLNTNFEIDLPYDIPSDGVGYCVNIKEEPVKAGYEHVAVPKLDKDAFLVAKLTNWDTLNLMAGPANIIMDNIFLGKTYINPNIITDTLDVSLGRDQRIAIQRKRTKDFKTYRKNDNKIEQHAYEIIVRNNKKQAVEISIKDQYPISRVKEVEVNLGDTDGASTDPETGILTWSLKLKPGESKKIKFGYQIKYPKNMNLQETH
ncbi:MAG: hypothetical protein RL582_446 [Bacteroidota bacterium]|jgi:uncharacterized protein (TIGR02231 family)